MELEKLSLYRGKDIKITEDFMVKIPTIGDIERIGEKKYFSSIHSMCSVGADLKWQLDDVGIDYTQIEDYTLFIGFLYQTIDDDVCEVLFGDKVKFSKMKVSYDDKLKDDVLIQDIVKEKTIEIEEGSRIRKVISKILPVLKKTKKHVIEEKETIVFNRYIYNKLINVIRAIHLTERNNEEPANEITRRFLIDDAREEYIINKDKEYESTLLPLVSTLVSIEGCCKDEKTIFDTNIYVFMDMVHRIAKIKKADLLLNSGYSGFGINLKDVNKKDLDYMG